jgi:hypothetical protein
MAKQAKTRDGQAGSPPQSPSKKTQSNASEHDDGGVNLSTFRLLVASVLSLTVFAAVWAGALTLGMQFHNHIHTQELHLEKFLIEHPGMLILSQGRSGGSFLGSWFQSSPKFLYLHEPCAVPYTGAATAVTGKACVAIVNELYNCEFSSVYPGETARQVKVHDEFEGWGNRSSVDDCAKQLQVSLKRAKSY